MNELRKPGDAASHETKDFVHARRIAAGIGKAPAVSRPLFIRTMTVGSGIAPDLLTLPAAAYTALPASARGLGALHAITAGGELHPALRTFAAP